ncbi:unnamed protein product [Caenorhabditis angaria]|uniref:Serpentine Receptor, class H n=1 Tax=Caenorhabditis angaria TaxID=860376 RepID=A0A9P1IY26_9PELO|nr:unnamed protein product [Caenorhabditis angaria]
MEKQDNHFSFFETPNFVRQSAHILSIFTVPIYWLGFYCILYKTPENVKSVKNCMLITFVLCFIQDIDLTFLTIPYVLIPSYSGFPIGIMSYFGISVKYQTYVGLLLIYVLSQLTQSLQKRLFFGVCVQVLLPFVSLIVPLLYIVYSSIFEYYNQILNNFGVLCMLLHGFLSGLTMLLIHRPYRDVLFSKFKKKKMASSVVRCFIQDIDLTFLTVPFILLPSYSGFPVGIMSHVGVSIKTQTVIGVFIIYGVLTSIAGILQNQYHLIKKVKMNPLIIQFLLYFINILTCAFSLFDIFTKTPNQAEARERVFKSLPPLYPTIYEYDLFVITEDLAFVSKYIIFLISLVQEGTFSYLESPEFLKNAGHFVSLISIPIYFLGFYCILYKTPDYVKSVKNCMMITCLWCFIQDIDLTFLTVPFVLIPRYAGFPVRCLSKFQ